MTENQEPIMGKVGRETDYKPEFCQMLIDHMAEGLSFKSFGGVVGVTEKTLFNWEKVHEQFLQSKNIGHLKSMYFYEQVGKRGMMNDIPFFNDRIYRLNMINRFRADWIDGTKNENNDKVKTEIIVRYEGDTPNDSEAT